MSGKDESIFSMEVLRSTQAGKDIMKQGLLRSKGYRQFNQYKEKTEQEFSGFSQRFVMSLHKAITADTNPTGTIKKFADDVGSQELPLPDGSGQEVKTRLSNSDVLEEGFKDARIGQYVDVKLKIKPASINDENMAECYKKYRAVMGTAGRNMALNRRPLSDIFHLGMAKAGECVGCGNEIEDAIKNNAVKVPSWPLYYALNTGDVRRAFELTMAKSELYLDEAKIALDMLPKNFQLKPFLEFLFLTVRHYNQYWYNELVRHAPFADFQRKIEAVAK